jgi:hypothetical protein
VANYTAIPRLFDGKDQFGAAFFELLEAPITLVLHGSFSFGADTTPQLLREKVSALVLDGKLRAPRALLPMIQVLCIARNGKIQADDELE